MRLGRVAPTSRSASGPPSVSTALAMEKHRFEGALCLLEILPAHRFAPIVPGQIGLTLSGHFRPRSAGEAGRLECATRRSPTVRAPLHGAQRPPIADQAPAPTPRPPLFVLRSLNAVQELGGQSAALVRRKLESLLLQLGGVPLSHDPANSLTTAYSHPALFDNPQMCVDRLTLEQPDDHGHANTYGSSCRARRMTMRP